MRHVITIAAILCASCATTQPQPDRQMMVCQPVETGAGIGLFCTEVYESDLKGASVEPAPVKSTNRVWAV